MLRFLAWRMFAYFLLVFFPVTAFTQSSENENPYKVSVSYIGDLWGNLAGGVDSGFRYLDNIDVNLEIDFGVLPLGLEGTTLYVYGLGNQGNSISELAGDVQGISNIEVPNSWRFFEVWAQKKFFWPTAPCF